MTRIKTDKAQAKRRLGKTYGSNIIFKKLYVNRDLFSGSHLAAFGDPKVLPDSRLLASAASTSAPLLVNEGRDPDDWTLQSGAKKVLEIGLKEW